MAFPASCMLRVTHCLKVLGWRSFLSGNGPRTLPLGRGPTLTGKVKVTSKVCSIMFPLQKKSSEPRSVWNIIGSCRGTRCVSTWILALGDKIHILLSGSPNTVRPGNFLIIHPIAVFFLMTELTLLPLGDFKGWPPIPLLEPF